MAKHPGKTRAQRMAIEKIAAGNPAGLSKNIVGRPTIAAGVFPVRGFLR
jgi:hypothetical protein